MRSLLLGTLLLASCAASAQPYLNIVLTNAQTRQVKGFAKPTAASAAAFETGIALEYLFPRIERHQGQAVSLLLQATTSTYYGQSGFSFSHLQLPVVVAAHTPALEYKDRPLFDGYLGAGYFFDFPLTSNYSSDPASLDFTGHGLVVNAGLSFFTAYGGKFDLSLFNTTAVGAIKKGSFPAGLTPPLFNSYGFRFAYGTNLKNVFKGPKRVKKNSNKKT